ncbi:QCR10 [Candida pseudojiufengensis]|uniref:QCR10 n=1 Tax=Candida pseudojiufengensis TaxID=497109 RepID=UPI0022244715|nr:QCR10 [Candida pseudojiufengensis]KAI5966367.1 QCR10 [Candida pseudojiufengensis]
MVSYIKGPVLKALAHFGKLNPPLVRSYTPDLLIWGGTALAVVATFTEGWPLFQQTFYQKIPYFGQHWIHNPDPEEVPV